MPVCLVYFVMLVKKNPKQRRLAPRKLLIYPKGKMRYAECGGCDAIGMLLLQY